jgi:hypothetical protein
MFVGGVGGGEQSRPVICLVSTGQDARTPQAPATPQIVHYICPLSPYHANHPSLVELLLSQIRRIGHKFQYSSPAR